MGAIFIDKLAQASGEKIHMKIKVALMLTLLAITVIITSCGHSQTTLSAAKTDAAKPIETSAITLSPAPTISTPISSSSEDYQLAPWTADRADETITKMEEEVLGFWEAELEPWERFPPYAAVWYVVGDALTQFPDDPRQEKWRWKMAYYMALAGEGYEAIEIYADLIANALNQDGIRPQDLPDWFRSGEMSPNYLTPLFALEIEPITVPGREGGYLLNIGELTDIDTPGSSCVLLVENEGVYKTYIIYDGFPEDGFWIGLRNPSSCNAKDVTDDGIDEIICDQWIGGHVGTGYVRVFDITSLPPKAMPFSPAQEDYLAVWNSSIRGFPKQDGKTQIQISRLFASCTESVLINFQWNGAWFEVSHGEIEFWETPYQDEYTTFTCAGNIQQFASELNHQDAFWIYDGAYTAYLQNEMNSIEMLDEFRVLMGLTSAYQGDYEMTRSIFRAIEDAPTTVGSIWIEPAQEFLQAFQSPSDLYRACSLLEACVPYYAGYVADKECVDIRLCDDQKVVEALISTVYSTYPLEQIPGSLRLAGLDVRAEGLHDFDRDGRGELWFNVLPPGDTTYQFWIVAEYNRGIKPLMAFEGLPSEISESSLIEGTPIEVYEDFDFTYKQTFALVRHPLTDEPFIAIHEVMEPSLQMQDLGLFLSLRKSLYAGNDPRPIYEQLLSIDNESAHCPFEEEDEDGIIWSVYDCAAFNYTLAFAAELAGKEKEAIERYFYVFNRYPARPFALLAQAKLVQK
jgi:hypothetical protein